MGCGNFQVVFFNRFKVFQELKHSLMDRSDKIISISQPIVVRLLSMEESA